MCGICGIYGPEGGIRQAHVQTMVDTMRHRGPDASGVWRSSARQVGLGHARLSILDLSPLGSQPMTSACGRFTIAYNGEAYNHLGLRRELGGYPFKSTSDTETILAGVARWGTEATVKRLVGMFAFALWDEQEQTLTLVRDRMGIKPLYYGQTAQGFVFASELKAIRALPGFSNALDRNALALYFRHNYVPAPHSIYEGIHKLEPGSILTLRSDGAQPGNVQPAIRRYWSTTEVWSNGQQQLFAGSEQEAVDALETLLMDAVGLRMLSDVPLGAFLSGGIDSSTVVAMMQAQSSRPVQTFSIGFAESDYNEAEHAKAVAQHLGTDHTELYVTAKDLLDVVPDIPRLWDEPFADSSQIPTYILSKLTREHVTVSLSGDGGDELFSGYSRYFWMDRWKRVSRVPRPVRATAGQLLKGLPASWFDILGPIGPKIRWRLDILGMKDFSEFYRYFISHFKRPTEFVAGSSEPDIPLTRPPNRMSEDRFAQMALWDLIAYLPDDILTKVDRASMGVSLEARVPLLDHRLVAFAATVPTSMKVRDNQGKWLLRQALYRHVPQALIDRPKMGFGVPIEQWMRKDLRPWCEDLLSPDMIRRQGYLDADMVERMWREYREGESNWNYYLWDVLMFQAWLQHWC